MTVGYIKAGTLVGNRWRIVEHKATGGQAVVYLASDGAARDPDQALVALKVYLPGRADEQRLANLSRLPASPYIAAVLDWGVDDSHGYYSVTEWVIGKDLRSRDAASRVANDPQRFVQIFSDVLAGLVEAHRFHVVHRDITPGNIVVRDDGRAKLIDFDAAKHVQVPVTRERLPVLTPGYAPPEILLDLDARAATYHSDVFSVAATMFRVLTGYHIWRDGDNIGELLQGLGRCTTEGRPFMELMSPFSELPSWANGAEDFKGLLRDMLADHASARPSAADARIRLIGSLEAKTLVMPRLSDSETTGGISTVDGLVGLATMLGAGLAARFIQSTVAAVGLLILATLAIVASHTLRRPKALNGSSLRSRGR